VRKAINLIKTVIGVLRQIATSHTLQICIEHLKNALEVLEHPRWYTPECWEAVMGKP
jgi:hypothetical protein